MSSFHIATRPSTDDTHYITAQRWVQRSNDGVTDRVGFCLAEARRSVLKCCVVTRSPASIPLSAAAHSSPADEPLHD